MYFKSVSLENFRNYGELSLEFDSKLNLITGQNAQGKTNLIESLFIMGLGKSFRTSKDNEMISFDKDYARSRTVVVDGDKETSIEIIYKKEGKIIKVDGASLQKNSELLENVYIVVFSPDDLRIVKDGPESRRKFIDRELCQIKPIYYSDLGNYKKVLKQRNYLLKNDYKDRTLFEVFDDSLAEYGSRIIEERYRFTERLSEISRKIHSDISGNKEVLDIKYETSFRRGVTKDEYLEALIRGFERDRYRGFTETGPHKDDLCILVDGKDIRAYGSQGQQRTASLSLKLAEIELIRQETGKSAVLLLDDVLSELDMQRQKYLIDSMADIQVFITATEIDKDLRAMLPEGKTFFIDNGKVDIYNY